MERRGRWKDEEADGRRRTRRSLRQGDWTRISVGVLMRGAKGRSVGEGGSVPRSILPWKFSVAVSSGGAGDGGHRKVR